MSRRDLNKLPAVCWVCDRKLWGSSRHFVTDPETGLKQPAHRACVPDAAPMLGEAWSALADALARKLRSVPRVTYYSCSDDSLLCDECGFFRERHDADGRCPVVAR